MKNLPTNSADINLSSQPPSESLDRIQPQPGKHKHADHIGGARRDYTTSQLCIKCRRVFDSWLSIVDAISKGERCVEYAHWDNVRLFEEAASNGCHLCIHFFAQFSEEDIENAHRALGVETISRLWFTVMSTWNGGVEDVKNWSLTLSLPVEEGLQLAYMGMTSTTTTSDLQEVAPSTRDIACLKQAKDWLEQCGSQHRGCILTKKTQYPARLIAVDQDIPRLVLSAELSGPGYYATLSHCWGKLQILRLLKNNFESLRKGIPWEDLSQTFQDACFVAKYFGYGYIWIDSLCIIQDDAEDWAAESVLMSSIYGCSSLNIAAAKAGDGSVGLFFPRNPKSVERIQFCLESGTVQEDLTSSGDGYCSGILYDCAPKDIWKNNVSKSVLGRRAWVLQERFLSSRTLFFSTQLFWTCGNTTACETFPENLPELFHEPDEDYRTHNNSEHWLAIVRLYTACRLTFKKDRLIALSGIAETLQWRYDDEYVAGLWKKDLYRQLQWKFKDTQRVMQGKRPPSGPPFQAPSWSWAAVDGPVFWLPDRKIPKKRLYEILEVDIKPRRQNPYGDIISGELRLRCQYLVPFNLPKPPNSNLTGFEESGSRHSRAILVSHPQKTKILIGGQELPDDVYFTWDFTERNENQLYLLLTEKRILQTKGLTSVEGFVLQHQDSNLRDYRRLAVFDIYRTSLTDWVESLASCGIHLPNNTSFASGAEGETTICII